MMVGVDASPDITIKPPCLRDDALIVLRHLRDAGHEAYFAGGCVRDLLLGKEPKDFDVATNAPPTRVRDLFKNTQAVGAAFGVVLVRQGKSVVEVATFRSDGPYIDGRHPSSVKFSTAEEDAQRRDFTINGLFLDPAADRVIDYVGGEADLKAKIVRAIGDPFARFREDHLRLLRAVRFAARLGFAIEPKTSAAIAAEASKLPRISPERIADELRLMLTPPTRTAAWMFLWQHNLINQIFRHLPGYPREILPADRDVFLALAPGQSISFALALAAIVQGDPNPKSVVSSLRKSLRISNAESDAAEEILLSTASLLADPFATLAKQKRFLASTTSAMALDLLRAIAATGQHRDRIASLESAFDALNGVDVAPVPLLTGDDLTNLGFQPGPIFKRVLTEVYDAQLEGKIATKEDAEAMAKKLRV